MLGGTVRRLWRTTHHCRRAYLVFDHEFHVATRPNGNRIVHDEHHMLVRAIEKGDANDAGRMLGRIRRTRLELSRHPEVFEH